MKVLVFNGRVTSLDKEPLFCREEVEITTKETAFRSYPLSLLKIKMTTYGITIDDVTYWWQAFPITIQKAGKHSTKYREIIEESITITVELK